MIGMSFFVTVFLYVWLSRTVIRKVYDKTKSLTKKRIAIAIFILIPTWDLILGFPIYAYLCATQSGVKIYKSVDNVEGFYVGEQSISSQPVDPYNGYRFIDYKEKENGKYYRSYWLENNTSELCVPLGIYLYGNYATAFKQGKCIAKEEITEDDVSRWEEGEDVNGYTTVVPFYIDRWNARIMDKKTNKPLAELVSYSFRLGWLINSLPFSDTGNQSWTKCSLQQSYQDMLLETLKPKQGDN